MLAELDWVQASVHGGQRASREELTKRVLAALDSPYVSCLSHPTGRLINHRPPNAVDLEAVFARLAEQGRAVEVNGSPRLDLRDEHVRLAREAGVAIVCSTPTRTRCVAWRTWSYRSRPPAAAAPHSTTCSTRARWTRCSRAASGVQPA